MTADFLRAGAFHQDAALRPALAVLGAAAGACVGRALRAWALRPLEWVLARVAVLICVLGTATGLLVGAVVYLGARAAGAEAFIAGAVPVSSWAVEGLVTALTVLPAFAAVTAAAWRVGRARPRSLVAVTEARAPWLMLAAAIAAGSLAALPNWHDARGEDAPWSLHLTLATTAGALASACALLALDFAALRRARALVASAPRMRLRETHDRPDRRRRVLDLGLADVEFEIATPSPTAYRGTDDVRLVVRGHPAAAHAALGAMVTQGLVAVTVSAACLFAALQLPNVHLFARIALAAPQHAAHATGVPECDLYVLEVERCASRTPTEKWRGKQRADALRESIVRGATTPGVRSALAFSCRSAVQMYAAGPECH
jgi:hypothetical protein